jgi:hypothetical protein
MDRPAEVRQGTKNVSAKRLQTKFITSGSKKASKFNYTRADCIQNNQYVAVYRISTLPKRCIGVRYEIG